MYPGGEWAMERRSTMPKLMVDRLPTADQWMERVVRTARAYDRHVMVGIELPVLGLSGRASANATIPNAMVHGALVVGARRGGAEVLQVNNQKWKKRIVGIPNAKKPEINLFVKKTWPALWKESKGRQDVCDAACIVQEVERIHRHRQKIAATRRRHHDAFSGLSDLPTRPVRR
jgi:hypothetical protein